MKDYKNELKELTIPLLENKKEKIQYELKKRCGKLNEIHFRNHLQPDYDYKLEAYVIDYLYALCNEFNINDQIVITNHYRKDIFKKIQNILKIIAELKYFYNHYDKKEYKKIERIYNNLDNINDTLFYKQITLKKIREKLEKLKLKDKHSMYKFINTLIDNVLNDLKEF